MIKKAIIDTLLSEFPHMRHTSPASDAIVASRQINAESVYYGIHCRKETVEPWIRRDYVDKISYSDPNLLDKCRTFIRKMINESNH